VSKIQIRIKGTDKYLSNFCHFWLMSKESDGFWALSKDIQTFRIAIDFYSSKTYEPVEIK
jgi:hypothetical protein